MKKYIFFVVGVMCTLLSHTAYAIDLNKSDANIIGHVLEKNRRTPSLYDSSPERDHYRNYDRWYRALFSEEPSGR